MRDLRLLERQRNMQKSGMDRTMISAATRKIVIVTICESSSKFVNSSSSSVSFPSSKISCSSSGSSLVFLSPSFVSFTLVSLALGSSIDRGVTMTTYCSSGF